MENADRPNGGAASDERQVACRVGDRAFAPEHGRDVVVDDVCGQRVRFVWEQDGIRRSAWVEAEQLEQARGTAGRAGA